MAGFNPQLFDGEPLRCEQPELGMGGVLISRWRCGWFLRCCRPCRCR